MALFVFSARVRLSCQNSATRSLQSERSDVQSRFRVRGHLVRIDGIEVEPLDADQPNRLWSLDTTQGDRDHTRS